MLRRLERISVRGQLAVAVGAAVVVTAGVFLVLQYRGRRSLLLAGVDEKLYVAAQTARLVPPDGYFDSIVDTNSVPLELFERIVDRNNRLCLDLDLQYLWSCLVLDGRIVFATSTSPSKDVKRRDHAGFLDVHEDPHAFDRVFSTMEPDYSSFHNAWGHGRMVLVPYRDRHGRAYCVGASVGMDNMRAELRRAFWSSIGITGGFLVLGLVASVLLARSLVRPIAQLSRAAEGIARGDMDLPIEGHCSAELASLADSIARMRDEIRKTLAALRVEVRERQAAEHELQTHRDHLEETVRRRTAELERSNKDLEQFAYIASHDLQEPLRKVSAFGDMLVADEGPRLSEQGCEYIAIMKDAAVRMQRLVNDLLTYSLVASRGETFRCVDLNEVARGVVADLAPRIVEAKGRVEVGDLPTVEADPAQMRQLLQNLVGNALKFRKEREPPVVRIRGQSAAEVLSGEGGDAALPAGHCRIVVEDNGIGFDEKYTDRIFRVFQRLHSRTAYEGSGIGLAICHRIVERHGGSMGARSRPGVGSAFFVTLPLTRSAPKPCVAETATDVSRP